MRKLRWLRLSVQKLTCDLNGPGARLIQDWVVGVYVAGSVILSAVARALASDKAGFEAALERLSRGMKDQHQTVLRACDQYRRRAARAMRRGRYEVLAIDLSEIVKPYGRKMPRLCKVRDASRSTRFKTVLEQGWWTVEVVATRNDHQVLPMWRHAYSTESPDYKSVQHELRHALRSIRPQVGKHVRAVLDRGFDGETYFSVLDDFFGDRWAIRQRGDRQIYLPGQDEPIRMSLVAKAVRKDGIARPHVVRDNVLKREEVLFGSCTVEVPRETCRRKQKKPPCRLMTLIVADRINPNDELPMMLLVGGVVRSPAQARQWVEDYYRRWGAEDETRGAKQLGGLEDIRVLSWESIQSIVALSAVVDGVLALLQIEAPRRANRLANLAPIDGAVPAYALYRLWVSVAILLQGRKLRR